MKRLPKDWALKAALNIRHSCLEADAFLHFTRFLECLCLSDGAGYSSAEDVADAVHWHKTMMTGQPR